MILTENDDILKFAIESGMIDISTVRDAMEMKAKEKILDTHNFKIYKGADGYWHTYTQKDGEKRKAVKKKTKDKLLDYLIDYYRETPNSELTFKSRYSDWVHRQELCGRCGNTISKYESDYKRIFDGSDFEKMLIHEIKETDIMQHFLKIAPEIPKKACDSAWASVKGVFAKAIRDRLIEKEYNPCDYVDWEIVRTKCKKTDKKNALQRVFSDDERQALKQKLDKPVARNYNYVVDRAVELAMFTGMRVGELCGLRWEDIQHEKGYILIQHSEKYNRKTKEYYIDDTKNHLIRPVPITEEVKDILDRLYEFEEKNGYLGEFVFMDRNGKVHTSKISDSARNKTMSSEFNNSKSIHALRRTINSNMKRNGVSTTVAAAILGHTERCNENNYTYDTATLLEKSQVMSEASKLT